MRNLLEVKQGLFVKASEIEALEMQDDSVTKVYTSGNVYESDIPLETLKSLLEIHFDSEGSDNSALKRMAGNIDMMARNTQRFGG
jgi:hypothetical protein